MPKTLPTDRLARVINESVEFMTTLSNLRTTLAQVIRDWGAMPDEARLDELREALDKANVVQPHQIPLAFAHLKTNLTKIEAARNARRKSKGLEPRFGEESVGELASPQTYVRPSFTLDDIEKKLKALEIEP